MTSDMERDARAYEAADAETPRPTVRWFCIRCSRSPFAPPKPWEADIVSAAGFGHLRSAYQPPDGHTLCGIDATGDSFWHRL